MSSNTVENSLPHVGTIIEHHSGLRFEVCRVLASGPFSDVFVVRNSNGETFAMKVEREVGVIRPVLKLDVYVLTALGAKAGFPHLIAAGRCQHYKYAVMQLVGVDVGKLRRAMPEKKFSLGTALRICKQTLERIETLHNLGWLCRDVKANNFAIGRGENSSIIYMLDFGFARRYMDKNGAHLPPRPAAALLGTIHYAPMAAHNNQDQCRRDDLESWLYMCVELCSGPLPWATLDPLANHQIIGEWKQFIRVHGRNKFFSGCPDELSDLLTLIDAVAFENCPPYQELHQILDTTMKRYDVHLTDLFDWQLNDNAVMNRAEFIGELGQSHLLSTRLREQRDALADAADAHDCNPPVDATEGDKLPIL
ncbi:Protein kinase domain-containing protein [Aphelenchoides besseyi]|nr:Protein kinase domain-containing protein [Aphelenchoides besseyi]